MKYKYLSQIHSPDDVKKLNTDELNELCAEMRDCIIETVAKNGGHLASNLGVVELTTAIHRVFSSPNDAIIFDVGHQCYAHKLLTGRFEKFPTIRTENGLSGFMRPNESEHDPFVTGHSSNSISAAYGIYKAKRIKGEDGNAVAVIGDGALTGGMAYEALNNAGNGRSNFIVVLNDNKMSISRNVGALSRSLTKMRNKPRYHRFKLAISRFLLAIPVIGSPINNCIFRLKEMLKSFIYKNNIFTSMGFNYLGPVDGHNISAMEDLFRVAQTYQRPSLIHVITTKGKGYTYAEKSPKNYHGVSPFDVDSGTTPSDKATYSDIVGKTLCDLAENDDKICAITAAMTVGTGLSDFSSKYKNRFFDVGIAEQHAVTFSAGLAKGGMKPYFVVYSSFLQRGYDQIIHDAAIEGLPVRLLVDRAGIVGEDGESHQGIFDVAFLSSIPGMNIYSPCYFNELEYMIAKSAEKDELCAIRYPRGCENPNYNIEPGSEYTIVKNNGKRALLTYGRLFSNAVEAAKQLGDIDIIKLNKIYPLSDELIGLLCEYGEIQFFEEGIMRGGIAEHVAGRLSLMRYLGEYTIHALPDKFIPQSSVSSAIAHYGFDTESMIDCFRK